MEKKNHEGEGGIRIGHKGNCVKSTFNTVVTLTSSHNKNDHTLPPSADLTSIREAFCHWAWSCRRAHRMAAFKTEDAYLEPGPLRDGNRRQDDVEKLIWNTVSRRRFFIHANNFLAWESMKNITFCCRQPPILYTCANSSYLELNVKNINNSVNQNNWII